ncbi:hypothetical protein [uncultured Paraglaciecola sp.]|uniref:hypothetical protein n=1 Tax=uncultured Paraglaciecola sp. TaxID=1765024 RepID=UPI0030DCB7C7|tara:strand:+ start:39036 stop:39497 length:462 start_codon:yes stop_codon:yes gene_type:complete
MTEYKFICLNHRFWVDEHPQEAFGSVQQMTKMAEHLLQKNQPSQAIPILGTAFETAEIIFDKRLESPQLTTSLTSLAIMLAHAYAATNQIEIAHSLLHRLNKKLNCAIDCALGYATKVAFFEHCSRAIVEAKNDIMLATATPTVESSHYSQIH